MFAQWECRSDDRAILAPRECHSRVPGEELLSQLSRLRGRAVRLASHDSKEFWGVLFCSHGSVHWILNIPSAPRLSAARTLIPPSGTPPLHSDPGMHFSTISELIDAQTFAEWNRGVRELSGELLLRHSQALCKRIVTFEMKCVLATAGPGRVTVKIIE